MRVTLAGLSALALGDSISCDQDGNCIDNTTGVFSTQQSPGPATLCTDASCMMTGTPLPLGSSSLAAVQNTLSNNSSWIIPAVAIGGLLLAMLGSKR
jgi:hypothetical protein